MALITPIYVLVQTNALKQSSRAQRKMFFYLNFVTNAGEKGSDVGRSTSLNQRLKNAPLGIGIESFIVASTFIRMD